MSEKVVSLRGEQILAPGEVNPEVVQMLEDLLDHARSGEIKTVVAVFVHADDTAGSWQKGTKSYRLVGMLTKVLHDLCADME